MIASNANISESNGLEQCTIVHSKIVSEYDQEIQEVFHVYLNKFENAVTHSFLVIFGNNRFSWVSLISRNTQPSRKQFLIFIVWFETVSEDK